MRKLILQRDTNQDMIQKDNVMKMYRHKIRSASRRHPERCACIHSKTKKTDQRRTQRHSNMRLREAVVFAYMCEYGPSA